MQTISQAQKFGSSELDPAPVSPSTSIAPNVPADDSSSIIKDSYILTYAESLAVAMRGLAIPMAKESSQALSVPSDTKVAYRVLGREFKVASGLAEASASLRQFLHASDDFYIRKLSETSIDTIEEARTALDTADCAVAAIHRLRIGVAQN